MLTDRKKPTKVQHIDARDSIKTKLAFGKGPFELDPGGIDFPESQIQWNGKTLSFSAAS